MKWTMRRLLEMLNVSRAMFTFAECKTGGLLLCFCSMVLLVVCFCLVVCVSIHARIDI